MLMLKNLKKYEFCIIVPTYHEEKNILNLKLALNKNLAKKNYFLCFVDDSSNNLTKNKINSLFSKKHTKYLRCKNNDRCAAVKYGLEWCFKNIETKIFIEMDADLSHHPEDIRKNLGIIFSGNYNLIIFSKYLARSNQIGRQVDRKFISFFVSRVCNFLFNKTIKDYTNAFRVYDKKTLIILKKKKISFIAPLENLNILLFLLNKIQIKEIASNYRDRTRGKSMINFSNYFKLTFLFVKLLFYRVSK